MRRKYKHKLQKKMEEQFYKQHKKDNQQDLDLLNDETFGVGDDVSDLNDDWEIQHKRFSQFLENEKIVKSSPMNIKPKGHGSTYSSYPNDDDDEEVIIESSISQLGLDDDAEESFKRHSGAHSFEFKESRESWMSPSRGHDSHSNSLKDLMSPGDGVWASPSRGLLHDGDQIVPELQRRSKEEDENIIKKLFGGHDLKAAKGSVVSAPAKPINVEDLERGLRGPDGRPTMIERHGSPLPGPPGLGAPPGFSQQRMPPPPEMMRMPMPVGMSPLPPGMSPLPPGMPINPALMMMSPQMAQMARMRSPLPPMMGMSPQQMRPPPPAAMMSPHFIANSPHHMHAPSSEGRQNYQQHNYRGGRGGGNNRGRYNSPRYQNNGNRSWNNRDNRDRDYNNRGNRDWKWSSRNRHGDQPEPLIEMEPSKMMTSKEKEWIFKISMMSLLSGDFMASDYYFINYMKKQALQESIPKKNKAEEEEEKEEKDKAKNLVNYAQKHQQTKESHKPVKFEGSLGKLSITSVHHPRQIMDLSTPESEAKTAARTQESGRKKYILYGMVEKMHDLYLGALDIDDQLVEMTPEEQQEALYKRKETINKLFELLKVELHTTQGSSGDIDHFLHLLSICKARKLLNRAILIFDQVQSESILSMLIQFLPSLLKKDNRDQALSDIPDRIKIFLSKSEEQFKLKCLKMLRKINLKLLLSYAMSIRLLGVVLDSLTDKNPEHNIEWSYYFCEVPRMSIELSPEIFKKNQTDIQNLKNVLGASDLLIKID